MTPTYWNLVFTGLNLFWIARLLLERRPVTLSEEEQRLCELVFRTMTPREMIKLLKLATWEEVSGKACVEVDGRNVAELQPGQFIGSISYVTEEAAPANIVALEPTRTVSWPKPKLEAFMRKNPDLHSALKTTLAIDLARWLHATWARGAKESGLA
jgi:CRP-like cAMP-binding protein